MGPVVEMCSPEWWVLDDPRGRSRSSSKAEAMALGGRRRPP